ncbi:AMP-binding protein [Haloparvum sedimenti]|uniref:AMP-binding protein n=1 Tax=Haloparvum sedimenti TaxID=1678448 RepID=UPI0009B5A581|nr:AMP-binding protein [Haloparvum sedimenti]
MNMGRIFARAVKRYPEETAIVDQEEDIRYTYREWYDKTTDLAAALTRSGVSPGDRVAATMRNRSELATIYCATQLVGAVFIPLNFRSSSAELAYFMNSADPDLLFLSKDTSETVTDARTDSEASFEVVSVDDEVEDITSYEEFIGDGGAVDPTFVDPTETSAILFTGGTTGDPKGVPRTHVNTYTAAMAHAIQTSWSQRETTLGLMSLSHTMGLHTLAAILVLGGTWIAQRSFSAAETVDLVASENITSLYLVPTVYHDLVNSAAIEDAELNSVQSVSFAGASMTIPVVRQVADVFDPDVFVNHYGSTEVYTHTIRENLTVEPGSTGYAGINTEIRIVEPMDFGNLNPEKTVEQGELGEIIVDASSPEAFDGYLTDDSDEAARTLVDGWFFTGDLGYRDGDGGLSLVGRVDDMIISGGENIYPVEVEDVLEAHEVVREAAVVGRPSERWNQSVTAFVTLDTDPDTANFEAIAATLDEYCRKSDDLADFKRPRTYFFTEELAKSNVGKILRKELQKDDVDLHVYRTVSI